ncbi:uncharacterized protein [Aegilops tauschii subsp. strangulata]|uniref:uncharacterized protein isoform X2 n=1 Tax=Aegilops tauschii subsp. strangulata TaxID=200361 RepID=UPI003CC8BB8D
MAPPSSYPPPTPPEPEHRRQNREERLHVLARCSHAADRNIFISRCKVAKLLFKNLSKGQHESSRLSIETEPYPLQVKIGHG